MAKGVKTGGRKKGTPNKVTVDVKQLAQGFGGEAIDILASIARNNDAQPAARVAAVKEILDRGYGKAKQSIEVGGEDGDPIKSITEIRIVGVRPDGNQGS